MRKRLVALLVGSAVLTAGCGTTGDVVRDAGATPEPRPTGPPWPAYDVGDYTYTVRTACFCADRGVPVIVTVRDGKVTDAVFAHRGSGHAAGDAAGDWMRVTINDVIDAANTTDAYQVRVHWPDGRAYPTSVWVDQDENAADEEIGYSVRHVVPS
jgi:hypothetical protein